MALATKVGGFDVLCSNIELDNFDEMEKSSKSIAKKLNSVYYDLDNDDTSHLYIVGSVGRKTAIKGSSDLDILFDLPSDTYKKFDAYESNGQSALLQEVKKFLQERYPKTDISGDGQVVVIKFSDGMKFEILPAFKNNTIWGWDGTYKYPDSHMGGNWMSTNPKAEQDAIKEKNEQSNGLLYDACKHIRYIRDNNFQSYHLSGILIDSFMHNAIKGWHFLRDGEQPSGCRETFEEAMLKYYNEISLNGYITPQIQAPGSNMKVDASKGWDVLGKVLRYMV